MHIVVHTKIAEIPANQWNSLIADNNPFLRHEFLNGLELTQCVCAETGWQPMHLALYNDASQTQLFGAMPLYLKEHSYGEYIFDWAWVNAYHRSGLEYYPKLSNAVPFTPATGQRILVSDTLANTDPGKQDITNALIQRALSIVDEKKLSSFHSLFNTEQQATDIAQQGLLKRHSTQFHWKNRRYSSFDDFLSGMSSKKRKNIKRERRRVRETGINYRWLSGDELDAEAVQTMYQFYARTISYYGAQSYLKRAFFSYIAEQFNQQTLFLFAEFKGQTIAGGLYFKSDNTLYGRYWGALDNFHSVHFETCYYQAIDWCIQHSYQRFEAGAQGEHKLARGLEPCTTYSTHWISHPEFRRAIDDFVNSEQEHIEHYQTSMHSHSPFKHSNADTDPSTHD